MIFDILYYRRIQWRRIFSSAMATASRVKNNPLSVRFSSETKLRLKKWAKGSKRSVSELVSEAVENHLSLLEWQKEGVLKAIREMGEGKSIDGDIFMEWMMSLGSSNELPRPSLS